MACDHDQLKGVEDWHKSYNQRNNRDKHTFFWINEAVVGLVGLATKLVVFFPKLRIGQRLVCNADLFKHLFGIRLVGVLVWVMLDSQTTISLFNPGEQ